jgi:hypothetical protein
MRFLPATDIRNNEPKLAELLRLEEQEQVDRFFNQGQSLSHLVDFIIGHQSLHDFSSVRGDVCSRWELSLLASLPGGGGVVFRLCHTLIAVNTVRI